MSVRSWATRPTRLTCLICSTRAPSQKSRTAPPDSRSERGCRTKKGTLRPHFHLCLTLQANEARTMAT